MAHGKLKEIERLRGIAVLATMFVHWKFMGPELPAVLRDPESGVDLFFVISGFVVTASLLRSLPTFTDAPDFMAAFDRARGAIRKFYTRRVFRILPAAAAVILIQRLAVDVFPGEFGTAGDWQKEAISFFSGIYNYVLPVGGTDKFSVYWSLSVEEHFYLFLPLLFVALRTNSKRFGACVGIILVIALVIRPMGEPAISLNGYWYRLFSSQFRFDSLMAGTALALLWPKEPQEPMIPKSFVRFAIVPMLTLLIVAIPRAVPEYVWHRVGFMALWAMSAVLVGYAAADKGYVYELPVLGRALELLGARSYALYLIHFSMERLEVSIKPLIPRYAAYIDDPHHSRWVHFAALFTATLIVAELMHRLVEKPFIHVGTAVTSAGSEKAVPKTMRWAMVALGVVIVGFPARHAIASIFRAKDIARGCAVSASSTNRDCLPSSALVDGSLEGDSGFCTEKQDKPWMEIDLGSVHPLGSVRVYNRADSPLDEQIPLTVTVSANHDQWETLGTRDSLFTQGMPWELKIQPGVDARYVRLTVNKSTRLTLSEVEVFESRTKH